MVKNSLANAEDIRNTGWIPRTEDPLVPWRRARQPTLVFLPEESYGQRSLAGYSAQGRKESV